jgi:hypothetical protein
MDVTYDKGYAQAHPTVIYWDKSNVWAPDGECVKDADYALSGDVPAGRPHLAGGFVDARNFYGGEVWVWGGRVF